MFKERTYLNIIVVHLIQLVRMQMCCLEPLPQLNPSFYVKALLELHRQVCPVEQYPNLMILRLSNESLFETILPRIMSDYREYTKTISDQADEYYTYANDYYSCNLIPISHSIELRNARHVTYSIRTIFFYPKWMYKEFHMDPNGTIATAFRSGYEVVYDLDNTIEILHWNNHSRQTITIDPHNIVVPNEMHDLYGFEIELYLLDIVRKAMPFETYFLEHVANKINGTAYVTELFTGRMSVVPLFGRHIQGSIGIVAGMGTTFWAVTVPRAKPKSIVSVLVDPLDMYTWITYFISVLIMAVSLTLFGEFLGRRRFLEIVLELIMMSLAGPSRTYGGSFENRIITVFCLMGIVLVSSYQSLVISFMSYVRYHPEINTLAEIEERCTFLDDDNSRFFKFKTTDTNPGMGQLCFFEMGCDNEQRSMALSFNLDRDHFAFNNEDYIRYRIENYRYADTRFYERQRLYFVAPRLQNIFAFYFQAVFESGIYDYYYNNVTQINLHYVHDTFVDRVVKVSDLTLLWYVYGCGTLLCVVCFVMEIVIHSESKGL